MTNKLVISVTRSSGLASINKEQEAAECEPKNFCFNGLKRACRLGVAGKGEGRSKGLGNMRDLIAALVAEFVGTGLLVGVGCTGGLIGLPGPLTPTMMAADMNETTYCASPEILPHVSSMQPAIVFGLTVGSIIQMFGHISQAHLNPAVTVAAVVLGMLNWPKAILYAITQCLGAVFGFGILKLITPCGLMTSPPWVNPEVGFCTTIPSLALTSFQAILAEGIATAVLILVVCGVWDKRNAKNQDSVPIKFGLTIATLALALGPYTGASMNPARSLGPAMWNHVWTRHWIYWLAPMGSALLTSAFYRIVLWPAAREDSRDEKGNPIEEDGDPLTGVRAGDSKADGAITRL